MQQAIFTDADIEAWWAANPTQSSILTASITCRVCERPATQPIDTAGLLCRLCREDLDKTARYVEGIRSKTEQLFQEALRGFDTALGCADAVDVARYERVAEEQRKAVELGEGYAVKVARSIAKARTTGDGLAAILDAKAGLEEVSERVAQVFAWAARAEVEIAAAHTQGNT